MVDRGADGVIVSNHGGRQLVQAPTPLEQLPSIVEEVGDRAEVLLDGGILDGGDWSPRWRWAPTACLVARAYLFGLMAGGEAGVQRAADLLGDGIRRTMALMGATSVADLTPEHVRIAAESPQAGAPVADHRGVIILLLFAWIAACAGVTACCVAARRGDDAL